MRPIKDTRGPVGGPITLNIGPATRANPVTRHSRKCHEMALSAQAERSNRAGMKGAFIGSAARVHNNRLTPVNMATRRKRT